MQDSPEEFKNLVDFASTPNIPADSQQINPQDKNSPPETPHSGPPDKNIDNFTDILDSKRQKIEPADLQKIFTSEVQELKSEVDSSDDYQIELTDELKESIYELKDEFKAEDIAEMFEIRVEQVLSYLGELQETLDEKQKSTITKLFAKKFSIEKIAKMTKLKETTVQNFISQIKPQGLDLKELSLKFKIKERELKMLIQQIEESKQISQSFIIQYDQELLDQILSFVKSAEAPLTKDQIFEIEEIIQDMTKISEDFENPDKIHMLLDGKVSLSQIKNYVQNQRKLSEAQKYSIEQMIKEGDKISKISQTSGRSIEFLKSVFGNKYCLFADKDGQRALKIIQDISVGYSCEEEVRTLIIKNSKKFRFDIQQMFAINIKDFQVESFFDTHKSHDHNKVKRELLNEYFSKFDETKSLLQIRIARDESQKVELFQQLDSMTDEEIAESLDLDIVFVQFVRFQFTLTENEQEQNQKSVASRQFKLFKSLEMTNDMVDLIDLNFYRQVGIVNYDQVIKKMQLSKKSDYSLRQIFEKVQNLCLYLIQCNQSIDTVVELIQASTQWTQITPKDLFIFLYENSTEELKATLLEQFGFCNPFSLIYYKSKNENTLELQISKELVYFTRSQMAVVSFGIGKCNQIQIGKSSLLDQAFHSDFLNFQQSGYEKSYFQNGSVDIQLSHNVFPDSKNNLEFMQTQWAILDCSSGTDDIVIDNLVSRFKIALIHAFSNDLKHCQNEVKERLSQIIKQGAKQIIIFLRDEKTDNVQKVDDLSDLFEDFDVKYFKANLQVYRCPNLQRNVNKNKLELTSIANQIIKTKRSNEYLLNQVSIQDLSLEFKKTTQDFKKVELMIQQIISYAREQEKYSMGFLNFYPSYKKIVDIKKEIEFKRLKNIENEEYSLLQNEILANEKQLQEFKMNKNKVITSFVDILNDDQQVVLLQALNRKLCELEFEQSIEVDKSQLLSISHLQREIFLIEKYIFLDSPNLEQKNSHKKVHENASQGISKMMFNGESIELIDGDTLKIHHREIGALLQPIVTMDQDENELKSQFSVISVFGKQSSGKSTLLNNCFGCKFLTAASRCTKGVNMAIRNIHKDLKKVGHHKQLILDTEGLFSTERKNSKNSSQFDDHFDRAMVTFCLAVSHAVIINIRGDLDTETQDLIGICGWALSQLQVSHDQKPKIYIVLNQQSDPNQTLHKQNLQEVIKTLNQTFEKNVKYGGVKLDDLVEIHDENLFILPNAFKPVDMNCSSSKLYDFQVTRQIPQNNFALKCNQFGNMVLKNLQEDKALKLKPIDEWIKFAGDIWKDIVAFPELTRFKSMKEMYANQNLVELVTQIRKINNDSSDCDYSPLQIEAIKKIQALDPKEFNHAFEIKTVEIIQNLHDKIQRDNIELFQKHVQTNDDLFAEFKHIVDQNKNQLIKAEQKRFQVYFDLIKKCLEEKNFDKNSIQKSKSIQEDLQTKIKEFCSLVDDIDQFKKLFDQIWDKHNPQEEKNSAEDLRNDFKIFLELLKVEFGSHSNISYWFEKAFSYSIQTCKKNFSTESLVKNLIFDFHDIVWVNLARGVEFNYYHPILYPAGIRDNKLICLKSFVRSYQHQKIPLDTDIEFFNSDLNKKANDSIFNIRGKKGHQEFGPKYLSKEVFFQEFEDNTVKNYVYGYKYRSNYVQDQNDNYHKIQKNIPREFKSLLQFCTNRKQRYEIDHGYLSVKQLAQILPKILQKPYKDGLISIWEQFLDELEEIINKFSKKSDKFSSSSFNDLNEKIVELKQEADHELSYIYAQFSNSAVTSFQVYAYVNVFLSFHQDHNLRRMELVQEKLKMKDEIRRNWLARITSKTKFENNSLKVEDRVLQDRQIAKQNSQILIRKIKEQATRLAEAGSLKYIESIQHNQLENSKLMELLTIKIQDQVSNLEEAKSVDDKRVMYVTRRNDLLKEEFEMIWAENEASIFKECQNYYIPVIKKNHEVIKDVLDNLIFGLQKIAKDEFSSKEYQKVFDVSNLFELMSNDVDSNTDEHDQNQMLYIPMAYLKWIFSDDDSKSFKYKEFSLVKDHNNQEFKTILIKGQQIVVFSKNIYPNISKPSKPDYVEDITREIQQILEESGIVCQDQEIYNLYVYLTEIRDNIDVDMSIKLEDFKDQFKEMKEKCFQESLGCDHQCPSCNKFCELKKGHNTQFDTKHSCKLYGHQYLTMGGKVWLQRSKLPVLQDCLSENFKDDQLIIFGDQNQTWMEFKKQNSTWEWDDGTFKHKSLDWKNFQVDLWNKCGQQICEFYNKDGTKSIKFKVRTEEDEKMIYQTSSDYQIFFVIDATSSMATDIERARQSIINIANQGFQKKIKFLAYRDHCDSNLIDQYPRATDQFSDDFTQIVGFIRNVQASGGGDGPEAALDGLAIAATDSHWDENKSKLIIHIYDAPPHGSFPCPLIHDSGSDSGYCCCCNHGSKCNFDWQRDVIEPMKQKGISYKGLRTRNRDDAMANFENYMRNQLQDLCQEFVECGKEVLDQEIAKIFIDK